MEALPGFVLAALALVGSPGPAVLSIAALAAAFGARDTARYMAGIDVGMLGVIVLVATGVAGMVLALPGAKPVVAVGAGLYFVWLAWRIATAPPLSDAGPQRPRPSFAAGFLLAMANPKGWAAMIALFSGFTLVPGALALDSVAKGATIVVLIVAVNVAWLFAGAALTRLFRNPRANRAINVVFAVALLVSVAAAFLM